MVGWLGIWLTGCLVVWVSEWLHARLRDRHFQESLAVCVGPQNETSVPPMSPKGVNEISTRRCDGAAIHRHHKDSYLTFVWATTGTQ